MLRRRAALPLARSWSPECMPAPCVWQEEEAEAERLASIVPLTADEGKEFDATTFSYRKKVLGLGLGVRYADVRRQVRGQVRGPTG